MKLHWFDIGAGIFLLGCLAYSGLRGFVKELFSVLAWVAGYFGSIYLHPYATPYTNKLIKTAVIADLVTFFVLFTFSYMFVRLLGVFANKRLGLEHIPAEINHGAGAIMGFAKWVFFLIIFLSPLNLFPEVKADLVKNSIAAAIVVKSSKALKSTRAAIPEDMTAVKKKISKAGKATQKVVGEVTRKVAGSASTAATSAAKTVKKQAEKVIAAVRTKNAKPVVKNRNAGKSKNKNEQSKQMDEFIGAIGE